MYEFSSSWFVSLVLTLFTLGLGSSSFAATVTNRNNSGPGSLREALAETPAGGIVDFALSGCPCTIVLTSGQLTIAGSLAVVGPGAGQLSISGNNVTRVFSINAGVTATLEGITIKDGHAAGGNGGGIFNSGTLTVRNSTISGNASPSQLGAGIYNSGTLIVSASTVSRNYINSQGTVLNIANSGGGIYNIGTTSIIDSTISRNFASVGGGIWNRGAVHLRNSTISGNVAIYDTGGYGAGILNYEGVLNISSCTVSGNSAENSLGSSIGGGITISGGTVTLHGTIVAGNTIGEIVGTVASASHNLIGDAVWSGGITNGLNGNIVGAAPMLRPLADNGGPTQTHGLQPNSPAVDKSKTFGLLTDQRGRPRIFDNPRIVNAAGSDGSDIGAFEQQEKEAAIPRVRFDFDDDGRSDISVFRSSDRTWYLDRSRDGFAAIQFGLSTDTIAPADFDGDRKADISVFRDGVWWRMNSSNGTVVSERFGIPGDVPVPADYTGDGRAELAVYRGGTWWILDLSNNQASTLTFGLPTDKPVPADYDGDGRTDQAVYRNGVWHINRSNQIYAVVAFGLSTDIPVVSDYDGDGKDDPAVYRDGTWYALGTSQGFTVYSWGLATDTPVAADYDGDGKSDPAIYRGGAWYVLRSTGGVSVHQFGLSNDQPVPSAFLP